MKLTSEQEDIIGEASASSNLQIRALAGTGKTTALSLLDSAMPVAPRLYLAFNKRIVDEIMSQHKLLPTTECRTLNSLGHRVWSNVISARIVLNTKKTYEIFREVIAKYNGDTVSALWDAYPDINEAVGLAKALGYIPEGVMHWQKRLIDANTLNASLETPLSPFQFNVLDEILCVSIRQAYAGLIDFNDQLYMSALFGGTFPRFPTLFVDEDQDLSPVNNVMIAKMVKHSRIIAVGDPYQSIYQFRGAMQDGMQIRQSSFDMRVLPLSISFRCPSEIVKNARWRATNFAWLREGGHVEGLRSLDLSSIPEGSAIICRNNAPLFRIALKLLSIQRSVSMAGTDIGPRLVGILRRLGTNDLPRPAVLVAIDSWEMARENSVTARDMADCLRIFANLSRDLGSAIAYAEHLFKQQGNIHLSTGHKAKGLEWEWVYHLDPWLLGTDEQDLNLRYVIETRSRHAYYEIDSDDIVPVHGS